MPSGVSMFTDPHPRIKRSLERVNAHCHVLEHAPEEVNIPSRASLLDFLHPRVKHALEWVDAHCHVLEHAPEEVNVPSRASLLTFVSEAFSTHAKQKPVTVFASAERRIAGDELLLADES